MKQICCYWPRERYRRPGGGGFRERSLFPGLFFAAGEQADHEEVRRWAYQRYAHASFICPPNPASQRQLRDEIRKVELTLQDPDYKARALGAIKPGTLCEVIDGPFLGRTGTVLPGNGKLAVVQISLPMMGRALVVEMRREYVEPITGTLAN